jgi:hypothetical protein
MIGGRTAHWRRDDIVAGFGPHGHLGIEVDLQPGGPAPISMGGLVDTLSRALGVESSRPR